MQRRELWKKSQKWLKTGWLLTAGLIAVYIGAIEPLNRYRGIAGQKATGLGAVAFERASLRQAPAYDKYVARAKGVVGGVPGGIARGALGSIARISEPSAMTAALVGDTNQSPPSTTADTDRKLIRSGAMDLIVKSPAETAAKIRQLAERMGGFLVSSQVSGAEDAVSGSVTIRVPAARFEEARAEIRKLALRIDSDHIEAQDVTKDYVDRQAQLRNLRAQEEQYLGILKRARTVKDTLEVSEQLNDVRSQIEQQQAEFEALSKQIETVAFTVSLRAEVDMQVFGLHWRPLLRLKIAAREGLEGVGDYLASMVSLAFFLPTILLWLITILIGAAFGWRILRWGARTFFGFPKSVTTEKAVS